MRRWTTPLLLAAIVAAATWTLIQWGATRRIADPWQALPATTAVVIEVPDALGAWDRWSNTAQWWPTMSELCEAGALQRAMTRLEGLAENDDRSHTALAVSPLLLALIPVGDDVGALIVWPMNDRTARHALNAFGAHPAEEANGDLIASFQPDSAMGEIRFAWHEGLAMVATQIALLDDARAALAHGTRDDDTVYMRAKSTLGKGSEAHVMVNGAAFPRLLMRWFRPDVIDALDLPTGWTALDARVRPEVLMLSGVSIPEKPDTPRSSALMMETPGIPRMLPADVSTLTWIPEDGLHPLGPDGPAWAMWARGGLMIAQAMRDSGVVRTWGVLRTNDPDAVDEAIAATCPDTGACDTSRYREVRLTRMGATGAFEAVFGPSVHGLERPWCATMGDHAVFSDDPTAIHDAIDAWLDGGSLAEDLHVADFFQRHGSEAARTWWCDPGRSRDLLRPKLNARASAALDRRSPAWSKVGHILLQLSPTPDAATLVTMIVRDRAPSGDTRPGTSGTMGDRVSTGMLWSIDLPAPLSRKPDLLRNHLNNTRDVLVQDRDHRIHFLSATGQLQWTRSLDGPVLGEVHQVDRFRNGKLQLLFNTAGQVHLIDRNGKDLEGFPVVLKDKASAPLSVFDYDGKRDYRILLPNEEGRVMNLGIDGRPVDGWEAPLLQGTSNEPVRHLRIRSKDHLLVIDRAGGVHVWDRRGTSRYRAALTLEGLDRVLGVRTALTIDEVTIIWLDKKGKVERSSLNGASSAVVLPSALEQFTAATFDGREVMAVTRGDSLWVVSKGSTLFARTFPNTITSAPLVFDLGRTQAIGVVCADAGKLHLVDEDGSDLPGSPFIGAAPFSIADLNLDGAFELVTGDGGDRVITYRLP